MKGQMHSYATPSGAVGQRQAAARAICGSGGAQRVTAFSMPARRKSASALRVMRAARGCGGYDDQRAAGNDRHWHTAAAPPPLFIRATIVTQQRLRGASERRCCRAAGMPRPALARGRLC